MNTKNVRELGFKIGWKNSMKFQFIILDPDSLRM